MPTTAGAKPEAVDRRTVLVVDDSERVLEAARSALQEAFTVVTAAGAKEALERCREARPGVVVVDLVMPEVDGFATLKLLKPLGASQFIALAVRGDATLRDKARGAGFVDVVDKPFQAADLLAQVRNSAAAMATPEELVQAMIGQENGCPVLDLPDLRSKSFGRIGSLLGPKLRALAEDGNDKLIIDIGRFTELNADVVKALVGLITEAGSVGIRTAICSPNQAMIDSLREIAETRDTPYGPDRNAARQCLQ
jgi:CheY-like chemotaxis protein